MSTDEAFAEVLAANRTFSEDFALAELPARAARGLAVLTCMDSRIDPLRMLGLAPGDAKILRNAGARVTDDVLRTLVLASYLLGVDRVMVVAHTDCRMTTPGEEDVHEAILEAGGPDTRSISFLTTGDQEAALCQDVQRVRSWPYLGDVPVGGFFYDLATGPPRTRLLTPHAQRVTGDRGPEPVQAASAGDAGDAEGAPAAVREARPRPRPGRTRCWPGRAGRSARCLRVQGPGRPGRPAGAQVRLPRARSSVPTEISWPCRSCRLSPTPAR